MVVTPGRVAVDVPAVTGVDAAVFTVPTDAPQADGALDPAGGMLRPDPVRPGLGMELRAADAEPFRRA